MAPDELGAVSGALADPTRRAIGQLDSLAAHLGTACLTRVRREPDISVIAG